MRDLLRRVTSGPEVAPVITVRSFALALAFCALGSCKKDEPTPPQVASGPKVIALKVTEEGFEPADVKVKRGEPVVLKVTRTTDKTCATEILVEGTDINLPLPLNQPVDVRYTPNKSGQIRYGCAMGMMVSGMLIVE
jgi:plastocyanin domain-containing protein